MATKPLPSQEVLRQLLDYDPETGVLRWKERDGSWFPSTRIARGWNAKYAGAAAGRVSESTGYVQLTLFGCSRMAHRLIWKMEIGDDPDEVDHVDGDRSRNAWVNLRNVDRSTNQRNAKRRSDNSSGTVGVFWHRARQKWCARIRGRYIGVYENYGDAVAARRSAELDDKFHANHGRSGR